VAQLESVLLLRCVIPNPRAILTEEIQARPLPHSAAL